MVAFLIIILGFTGLIYGVLKISDIKKEDISRDSDLDKKLLSEKSRYFLGRYWLGFQSIIVGVAAITLGLILYLSQ